MYVWEEFNILANYKNQATVQILELAYPGNNYIVRYKEEIFHADRKDINLLKKK
jgi:hypothetical protein